MGSAIEDIEFLASSAYRAEALRELLHEPCDRDTLLAVTGASRATIARLLNDLEDRNWVEREGHQYALTDSGQVVGSAFVSLVDTVETERCLREVWEYLPTDLPGFTLGLFDDAAVTFTERGSPYEPIPRTIEMIESSGSMRLLSERSPKSGSLEAIVRNAVDGMVTELVVTPEVVEEFLATIPEESIGRAVADDCLTIFERASLPTDTTLVLYDARLGLYCRDELGVTRFSIDTDRSDSVTWGESIYEDLRDEAHRVDPMERMT